MFRRSKAKKLQPWVSSGKAIDEYCKFLEWDISSFHKAHCCLFKRVQKYILVRTICFPCHLIMIYYSLFIIAFRCFCFWCGARKVWRSQAKNLFYWIGDCQFERRENIILMLDPKMRCSQFTTCYKAIIVYLVTTLDPALVGVITRIK